MTVPKDNWLKKNVLPLIQAIFVIGAVLFTAFKMNVALDRLIIATDTNTKAITAINKELASHKDANYFDLYNINKIIGRHCEDKVDLQTRPSKQHSEE